MTTKARILYDNGIYHVYNRGHNHMTLFCDVNDYLFYLRLIKACQEDFGFAIYAICLMSNHYHLIIKDVGKDLPLIMDTINSVFARCFNEKYSHEGSVFDGPFKSNPVLTDYGFTRLYRYIIRNPVVAGITINIYDYPWVTTTREKDFLHLIDFDYVDDVFKKVCKKNYEEYLKSAVDDLWVDDIEVYRMEDDDAEDLFNTILFKSSDKMVFKQDSICEDIQKQIIRASWYRGITIQQLSKFTDLSKRKIRKLRDD